MTPQSLTSAALLMLLLASSGFANEAKGADDPKAATDSKATEPKAEETPKLMEFDAIEDVVYGYKDGLALTMDILTPKTGAKGIGIVLVSSGGWRSSKSNVPGAELEGRKAEHWLQGLLQGGFTLFVARHGSAPRYFVPEMVDDIRRSVRFVRHNAQKYGVDPSRLAITSGSSGGHLSLMVALTGDDGKADAEDPIERESSRVQAVVAWFPPTDLVNWGIPDGYITINKLKPDLLKGLFREITDIKGQLESISPIYFVTPDDPPLYLVHGLRDLTVPVQQSRIIKAKYEATGLPVVLVEHKTGGHTYWPGILDQYPAVCQWLDGCLAPKKAAEQDAKPAE
jgi:acetyl esterase/lipase